MKEESLLERETKNKTGNLLTTSLTKKLIMGATGGFLCLFLLAHLSGNLLLFKHDSGVAFNNYAEFMSHNEIIRLMEIFLFLGILFHLSDAVLLTLKNRSTRSIGYSVRKASQTSSWASRNMGFTGSLILVFLIVHLRSFFVPHRFQGVHESMYDTVVRSFQDPLYSFFYIVCMIVLAFHLQHGFQSAFQSLGLRNKKFTPWITRLGTLFSILVPIGFTLMPLYFLFRGQQ